MPSTEVGAEHWQAGTAMMFCACAAEGLSNSPPAVNMNRSNTPAATSSMLREWE